MSVDVRITGLRELERKLSRMERRIDGEMDETIQALAANVVDTARSRVPVRTGAARNSIRVGGDAFMAGGPAAPYFRIMLARAARDVISFDGRVWGREIGEGYARLIRGARL